MRRGSIRREVFLSLTFRVIAGASGEDDCPLYQLANFKKQGKLIEAFTQGGSKAVREFLIRSAERK